MATEGVEREPTFHHRSIDPRSIREAQGPNGIITVQVRRQSRRCVDQSGAADASLPAAARNTAPTWTARARGLDRRSPVQAAGYADAVLKCLVDLARQIGVADRAAFRARSAEIGTNRQQHRAVCDPDRADPSAAAANTLDVCFP